MVYSMVYTEEFMELFKKAYEFEWNKGNVGKNKKHGLEDAHCEEPFFDVDKVIYADAIHSSGEERFILLGKTKTGRLLFVAFTVRGGKVRVISARDLNKREVHLYEKAV